MQIITVSALGDCKEIQICILCEGGAARRERKCMPCRLADTTCDLKLTAALKYRVSLLLILMKSMLITLI